MSCPRISAMLSLLVAMLLVCTEARSISEHRSKRTVDKCDSPFVRRLLEDGSGQQHPYPTCNDGSPSGFYLQRPTIDSTTWVIYLEGGDFCADAASCQTRQRQQHARTSSTNWGLLKIPGSTENQGILSSQERINPYLHSANKVYMPYCSSDFWSGTQTGRSNNETSGGEFVFSGALIFRAVVADLIKREGLATATRVIISGSSSGGLGVLLHIDYLRQALMSAGAVPDLRVQGIMDSAWYAHDAANCTKTVNVETRSRNCLDTSALNQMKAGYRYWSGFVPATCTQASTKPWLCYIASVLRPTVQSDIFVFQWYYDSYFTRLTEVPYLLEQGFVASRTQYHNAAQKILSLSNMVRKSLAEQKSINGSLLTIAVLPTCFSHANLLLESWTNPMPYGATLAKVVECHSLSTSAPEFERRWEALECGRKKRAFYRHNCRDPTVENSSCPVPSDHDFYTKFRQAISQIPGVSRHCTLVLTNLSS
ncbi:palmitoleoyl-protein carboxylesterase NOTUM-like [Sycon ciliatum]|uniref:palmitoleoyl-protein carboxylesterase NOTUM-like n=1 Tax=Sycon ciliatum TaxID=27933 RepID=UPI0031F6FAA3